MKYVVLIFFVDFFISFPEFPCSDYYTVMLYFYIHVVYCFIYKVLNPFCGLFISFPGSSFLVFLSRKLRSERIKVSGKTTNQKSLLMMTMMKMRIKMGMSMRMIRMMKMMMRMRTMRMMRIMRIMRMVMAMKV